MKTKTSRKPYQVRLTDPQFDFVNATDEFPCFLGGFGAGKTAAAIARAIVQKLRYPTLDVAYYLPTYDLVRRIGFPRFEETLSQLGIRFKTNKGDNVITLPGAGQFIFRTMDSPSRIIGYEVADSLVDELDTLKQDDAAEVWNKILGRNRQKKPDGAINTVAVATTPEGFRFVYDRWEKRKQDGYRLIRAPTSSNARNLPANYIPSLRKTYPTQQLLAYLDGKFVNLTSGSVYAEFDRWLNASNETIRPKEPLHVGMDFNVSKMAAAIHVLREDAPHAVGELCDVFDTPAMAKLLKDRFKDQGHPITVYPDSSGNARKSQNASESDLTILRQAGFSVCVNSRNPAVKDRILSVNAQINREGERRYRVNPDACPNLVEALEKQPYDKNGEPDKAGGLDHIIDAAGYFVTYRWPILKRTASITTLRM